MRWDSISMSLCVLISLRNLILTHLKRTKAKSNISEKEMLGTNFLLLGICIYPLAFLIHRFHFERKSYDNESSESVVHVIKKWDARLI